MNYQVTYDRNGKFATKCMSEYDICKLFGHQWLIDAILGRISGVSVERV